MQLEFASLAQSDEPVNAEANKKATGLFGPVTLIKRRCFVVC
jgi:hypothetical protein